MGDITVTTLNVLNQLSAAMAEGRPTPIPLWIEEDGELHPARLEARPQGLVLRSDRTSQENPSTEETP